MKKSPFLRAYGARARYTRLVSTCTDGPLVGRSCSSVLLIHPSLSGEGWRVSEFDDRGPIGHAERDDRDAAIEEAVRWRGARWLRPVTAENVDNVLFLEPSGFDV